MANNPFDQFDAPASTGSSGNPFDQFDAPAPAPIKRSKIQAVTDTAKDLAIGVGSVVKGVGVLGGLGTGNVENTVTQLGDSVEKYWEDAQSDPLKAKIQGRRTAIDAADGIVGKAGAAIKETVSDPALLVSTIARAGASMLPAGVVGRVGSVVGGVRAGTAAAIGTGAVQTGADVAGGTYQDAIARPDDVWNANPDFTARVQAGEDRGAVKHDMALRASRLAFPGVVALSAATQAIPGGATIERAFAGAAGKAVDGIAGRALGVVRGGAGEAGQEAIEEGGGQFIGNVAQLGIDPNADLTQGVGESAGLGAVASGGLGAVAGGLQRAPAPAPPPPPPNEPEEGKEVAENEPEEGKEVAEPVPEPQVPGPLARAAAAVPGVAPIAPQSPSPAEAQGQSPAQQAPIDPPPPGVDPATGEVIDPKQVKQLDRGVENTRKKQELESFVKGQPVPPSISLAGINPNGGATAAETPTPITRQPGEEHTAKMEQRRADALARARPDPSAGPASAAAAAAVDTGAAAIADAQRVATEQQQVQVEQEKLARTAALEQQKAGKLAQQEQDKADKVERQRIKDARDAEQYAQRTAAQAEAARPPDDEDIRLVIEAEKKAGKPDGMRMLALAKRLGVTPRRIDGVRQALAQARAKPDANLPALTSQPPPARALAKEPIDAKAQLALEGPKAATPVATPKGLWAFNSQQLAQAKALELEQKKGVKHQALPHPTLPGKFVAAPVSAKTQTAIPTEKASELSQGAVLPASEQTAGPTYDDSTDVLDDDIAPPSGEPFTIRSAADAAAKRTPGGKVIRVDGGFVVRKPRAMAPVAESVAATESKSSEAGLDKLALVPAHIKADALAGIARQMDKVDQELKKSLASDATDKPAVAIEREQAQAELLSEGTGKGATKGPLTEVEWRQIEGAAKLRIQKAHGLGSKNAHYPIAWHNLSQPQRDKMAADVRAVLNAEPGTQSAPDRRQDASRAAVEALPKDERDAEIARLREKNVELQRELDTDLTTTKSREAFRRDHEVIIPLDDSSGQAYDVLGIPFRFGVGPTDAAAIADNARRKQSGDREHNPNVRPRQADPPAVGGSRDVPGSTLQSGQDPSPGSGTEGVTDATRPLDTPSAPALAGAPAADVSPAKGRGNARPAPAGGGGADGARDGKPARGRSRRARGLGDGAGAVSVSGGGTDAVGSDADQPGLLSDAPDAWDSAAAGQPGLITPEPPQFVAEDFTITDDLELGEGGQKTKFKRNVAAIRLLNTLESEGRHATPDEQRTLALYVGWGSLAQAFDSQNKDWAKEHAELKELLTPEEYALAEQSTQYAHFTSRGIIGGIYAALRHLGYTGGKMLEAGGGVGNFIGLMPADIRTAGRVTMVERERISAGIAKHLYPRQNVQRADFAEFGRGDDGIFDVAVGNPPFGNVAITDMSGRKHLSGQTLHNFFIAKQIDMLRAGGILVNVVTNGFLDAAGQRTRKYIGERAKLLGAIRLPNNAFKANAGTAVTTDIVFFQKLPEDQWGSKQALDAAKEWLGTSLMSSATGGAPIPTNSYFANNPHMMLGDWGRHGSMYHADMPALVGKPGQDTAAALLMAVKNLPPAVFEALSVKRTESMVEAQRQAISNPPVSEGGYFVRDGQLIERLPNIAGEAYGRTLTPESPWTAKTQLGAVGYKRLVDLAAMRQTLRALLAAELKDDPAMDRLRTTLNEQYDAYAKDQLLHDPATSRYFDDDPDYPLLLSLELDYKPGMSAPVASKNGVKPYRSKATKAAIFSRRVVPVRKEVTSAATPEDAINVSLAERGRLDPVYIGELLKQDPQDVLEGLAQGAEPVLFMDPASGEYVLRDEYLSGNVRKKLAQARAAGMRDNARALERVLPEDIGAAEISVRIGAPWVPASVYEDFAKQLLGPGTTAKLTYVPFDSSFAGFINATSEATNKTYGIADYPAHNLILAMLNNRDIKVIYDSDGKSWHDKDATENARDKAKEIRDKFGDWVMQDGERAKVLVRAYNDANNNYVTRAFDGSWLTFPGKVPDEVIGLRKHQRNFVARGLQTRTVLADHVVGSGKTFSAIALAMELKRTGLANKPMIAVPNHLVKQWAADFYRLYPGANILTATKKDFERTNRRRFLAKIASNDWDAVIIAHSSYGFIRPSAEFEAAFIAAEKADLMQVIAALETEEGSAGTKKKSRKVKQMQATLERLDNRLKSLRDKPMDDLLDLEQIGVDQLFVDEAHMFKNLMFNTKMQNVRGMGDSKGSQRAYDMLVKTRQIFATNGRRGQGVVFLTGTPVSNSLAEMYHMMRYLMPDQMKDAGFDSFDAWANTYADISETLKPTTAGGYKTITAFQSFNNTFELLKMFDQVSDTVTMDDVKAAYKEDPKNKGREFPLPKLKTGRRQPVAMAMSSAQRNYMDLIGKRAETLEQKKGPPVKGEDNHLTLMSDARKAALDIRLVDLAITKREPGARLDRAAQEIVQRYQQFAEHRGAQLVFSDLGTPLKHAQRELKEFQELTQKAAPLTDENLIRRAELGDETALTALEDAQKAQDTLDSAGKDWLDAIKAAERGFSVYDDLKAALVERGIPEAQIAFIHDFNTDDQKAALFRRVNAGEIRVLMGSTAKMGAGTNVQERLVALHHLDIPWKPSDVEQREGRIVRQGNVLPALIPDFEVEVLAYVTKDTLDKNMWDIQERKIKGINQLRSRQISREFENSFDEMEMSASEMQAAATGNTDLLRQIVLNNDITKLERKKRAFDAMQAEEQSRLAQAIEDVKRLPARIERDQRTEKAAKDFQAELTAVPFTVTIDGTAYPTKSSATTAIRTLIDAKVTDDLGNTKPKPLNVTMDGVTYASRAKLEEAFLELRGDLEGFRWEFATKVLNRKRAAVKEVAALVVDAINEETDVGLGKVGPLDVFVTGRGAGDGVAVSVEMKGELVDAFDVLTEGEADAEKIAGHVVSSVMRIVNNPPSPAWDENQLEQAQKLIAAAKDKPKAEAWPDQGKLDALRIEHRDLIKRIAAARAEAQAVKQALVSSRISERRRPKVEPYELDAAEAQLEGEGGPARFYKEATAGRGLGVQLLQRVLARVIAGVEGRIRAVVVATHAELPSEIRNQPDFDKTVSAAISGDRSTMYFIASQISSPRQALKLWAHEAIGHFAIEQVLGPQLFRALRDKIVALDGRGAWPEVFAEVRRRYARNADGTFRELDDATFASEAIAVFAEKNIQTSVLQRAINGVRAWLRRLGFSFELSQGELSQMLWEAGQWLEGKAHRPETAESVLAPKPFAQQVRERLGMGPIEGIRGPMLEMGRTPAVLRMLGFPELPLRMSAGVLFKMSGGKGASRPALTERQISQLPELLDEAVAIFENRQDGGVLVLTTGVDTEGKPIVIAARPDVASDEIRVNIVPTAFGKDGAERWIGEQIDAGRLLFRGEKKNPRVSVETLSDRQVRPVGGGSSATVLGPADLRNYRASARSMFAKAGPEMLDRLQDLIDPKDTTLLERLRDKLADWRPVALGALQLRHLGELAQRILPPVALYSGVVQRMATMRNELQEMGHAVVEDGMKYQGNNRKESKRLFQLLHDATLAGVDLAEEHQPLKMLGLHYRENVEVTEKNVREFVSSLHKQAKLAPGSAATYIERVKDARKLLGQERKRRASYKEFKPMWDNLSDEGKALWVQMRDAYKAQSNEYVKALVSKIESLDMDKRKKAVQIAQLRLKFEAARVPFYVPLARWGQYWVSATDPKGLREFHMQESQEDQKRVQRALHAEGYTDIATGVKIDSAKADQGASASFMADIDKVLLEANAPDSMRDEVFQLFLRTLPDLSIRKNFIHRKGTAGYSQDAIRALAGHIFHGSFQIARLRYSHELESRRAEAEAIAKDMATAGDEEANAAGHIVGELNKRHDWVMNPKDNALVNKISSLGFIWYLGLTPAAALINLLQTAMVAFPVLAGRYNAGAAARELGRAMKESMRTYGHMDRNLAGDELEAHKEFQRRGSFDKTQAHNMAGISESDTHAYNPRWHKVMSGISHLFHRAEVVNREATAMAAYRLARAAGADHTEAVETADAQVHESQLDYSNANRARFMQSGTAKVLLMFRQYSLGMTWLLGRNFHQVFKGADAETRREAKRKLAGILGMTALFSGTLGLPVLGTVFAVLNAAAAAAGDDDEPWDAETEFRAFLRDHLGETGAEAVLRGPVQAATGVGIASRVSMGDLWFREPDRELEGRAWSNYLFEQAAGPMGGLITSFFRGQQLMGEGHVWRGVETMMPKAIKDVLKSIRYLDEGVNNLRGDAIVEDLNVFESLAQVAGFAPASVSNAYDTQRDIKNYEQAILDRRSRLMDAYALAWRLGDEDARTAVVEKMRAFSSTYPELAITGESIKRSLISRARSSANAENGVIIDRRIRARLEERLGTG